MVVLSARISEEHAMSFVGDVLEDWEGGQGQGQVQGGQGGAFQYVQVSSGSCVVGRVVGLGY